MHIQNIPALVKKYSSEEFIKKHEYLLSFLFILLLVTLANLTAVFGYGVLFQDDYARYSSYVNNDYNVTSARSFIGLGHFFKWIIFSILGTYSAELARLFVLLAFMVPSAFLFYHFNRKYLHLSIWVSLASAIIANSIPRQFFIPTFLDGSYPTSGMLFFIITLIITGKYLNSSRNNLFLFVTASIGWLLVCDLTAELGIFLFPVILYYIYSSKVDIKKKLPIIISTSVITAYRLFFYYQSVGPTSVHKPVNLSLDVIYGRAIHTVEWWLPYGKVSEAIVVVGCIAAMLLYIFIKSRITSANEDTRAYIFYAIWFLSSCFPFWFVAKYFGPRNLYIPYYALTALTLICLYRIFIAPRSSKIIISFISIFLIITLYSYQRNLINTVYFNSQNKKNDFILTLLSDKTINDNTQIALVNVDIGTGGYHIWSSGYLQYILKKPKVKGMVGPEKNFYSPFNLNHCFYANRMSCMDTKKELIAFKKTGKNEMSQMYYFLQWEKEGDRESKWTIYQADKKNNLSSFQTGSGLDSYKSTLAESNIDPEQVLWGNSNDEKSLEALSQKAK